MSLAPNVTEILFALGLGDSIMAVTTFCDYPAQARKKPKVGGWLNVKISQISSLEPDAVFTSNFLQEKIARELEDKGLKVVHTDPRTLKQVFDSIITIGNETRSKEKAVEIVRSMRKELALVKKSAAKERKRVYCEEWFDPPMASGNWVPELVEVAGGQSYLGKGVASRKVSLKEIKDFQPHGVVLNYCGFGKRDGRAFFAKRQDWSELVAAGKVFSVDDSLLNRPSPRLVQGAVELASIISRL